MGFRYRKSFHLGGGLRVNISSAGIGYSWGTKGYRVTKTAGGKVRQTLTIPGTGISYVEESGKGPRKGRGAKAPASHGTFSENYTDVRQTGKVQVEGSSSEEYEELFRQIKWAKRLNILLIICMFPFSVSVPALSVLCFFGVIYLHIKGISRIEYEMDEEKAREWAEVSEAWRRVASSQKLVQIVTTAKAKNKKVTAGIETAIGYESVSVGRKLPWFLKTNAVPVVFRLKSCKIAILPDRLFLFDKRKYGAISYQDITFDITAVGYLESEKVPTDAEIIRYAWAYANKDGSPDLRYKENKQFPVMKYGRIHIREKDRLDVQLMCSDEKAADVLCHLLGNDTRE